MIGKLNGITVGQKAPDSVLLTLDGQTISLASRFTQGRQVVLVFLRYLG
jgi:peroxiredoxin